MVKDIRRRAEGKRKRAEEINEYGTECFPKYGITFSEEGGDAVLLRRGSEEKTARAVGERENLPMVFYKTRNVKWVLKFKMGRRCALAAAAAQDTAHI
jgi:hypothetical protein